MEDYYLKFEFSSVHNTSKNMNYYVYAETMDDLKLFTSQHGFTNVPPESITLVKKGSNGKYDGSHVLEPYKFKSNSSDELLTVMTCWDFVEEAISNVAAELNQYMLFGEAIVRRDVEIFKVIGDIINGLDHGMVVDFLLCDYCPDDEYADDIMKANCVLYQLQKDYKKHVGRPTDDGNICLTYEGLCDAIVEDDDDPNKGVLPITIECYISNFTEKMMDAFT